MARPLKDGVDYFPKDTDFYADDKVRLLRAEFGSKGMYLLDYILCDLYGKNGYFIKWDKNSATLCQTVRDVVVLLSLLQSLFPGVSDVLSLIKGCLKCLEH